MKLDIITLFPEMIENILAQSITGRAIRNGLVSVKCRNLRDYSEDRHRRVDDYTYGGGHGMVFRPEPVFRAVEEIRAESGENPCVIYMSPQGKLLDQQLVNELRAEKQLIILCGHYEGVDERIITGLVDREISIGDYVLTGGELAAAVLADALIRTVPGALSEEGGFTDESLYNGLLEYPQYTRPEEFRGMRVPEVLLSGHHKNILAWRHEKSIENTVRKRPELLRKLVLPPEDKKLIAKIKRRISRERTVQNRSNFKKG